MTDRDDDKHGAESGALPLASTPAPVSPAEEPNDDSDGDQREGADDGDDAERQPGPPLVQLRAGPAHEVQAVLVRFRVPGQCAPCDAGSLILKAADRVIVDTEHGQTLGTVIRGLAPTVTDRPLSRVLRVVDHDDERIIERNRVREREAFQFCLDRIKSRNLEMKLLAVELAHSGTRAVFYFSSTERIDFRTLVKDLARRFHTRIDMRQVGVRDGARHTGGTGLCGRELCCATWLNAFKPISIRMAKDQNLALNHQKLSGLCGRLRCCLEYEEELYQSLRKGLPKVGKRVVTPQGEGRVKDVDVLRHRVRVQLMEGGYAQYDASEVTRPTDQPQPPRPPMPPARQPGPAPTAGPTPQAGPGQRPQAPASSQVRPAFERQPRPPAELPVSTRQPQPPTSRPPSNQLRGSQPDSQNAATADGDPARHSRRRRRRRGRRHGRGGGSEGGPGTPPSSPSTPTG
jgi:cell fate regulator YaaT (PSP1 superfamily)